MLLFLSLNFQEMKGSSYRFLVCTTRRIELCATVGHLLQSTGWLRYTLGWNVSLNREFRSMLIASALPEQMGRLLGLKFVEEPLVLVVPPFRAAPARLKPGATAETTRIKGTTN